MENKNELIKQILDDAERRLQEVIVESAKDGDYRSVDTARLLAVSIHELATQTSETRLSKRIAKSPPQTSKAHAPHKRKKASKKRKLLGYPKFELRKDSLTKIGWSKKQRREYTHKVPIEAIGPIIRTMVALANSGAGPFLAEQIVEKLNDQLSDSDIVPSYQIYIMIGLLRENNCINQIGREGYNIPLDFFDKVKEIWSNLGGNPTILEK